jgi:hypothetical protein
MSKIWWGNDYRAMLADCEKRLEASLAECARLRDENEKLRQRVRPPVLMIGMGGKDDGGAGDVSYVMSDGGW